MPASLRHVRRPEGRPVDHRQATDNLPQLELKSMQQATCSPGIRGFTQYGRQANVLA